MASTSEHQRRKSSALEAATASNGSKSTVDHHLPPSSNRNRRKISLPWFGRQSSIGIGSGTKSLQKQHTIAAASEATVSRTNSVEVSLEMMMMKRGLDFLPYSNFCKQSNHLKRRRTMWWSLLQQLPRRVFKIELRRLLIIRSSALLMCFFWSEAT